VCKNRLPLRRLIVIGGVMRKLNLGSTSIKLVCFLMLFIMLPVLSVFVNSSSTFAAVNPTLSVTNSPVTYNGSPQAATVTGNVTGIVTNVKYNGSSTVPTSAGTYAITADFVPTDITNYNILAGASAGNFVILKATPTLSVTNSPVTYNGFAQAAIVTAGSVPGTVSNIKYGGSLTQPTNVGTYGITADFAPNNATNYNTLTDAPAGFFTIQKATPTLSVTNSPVTYNGSQQAAIVTSSVPGDVTNIKYDGSSTVPTDAGTYAITADFAPTDTSNYNPLTGASAGNFVIQTGTSPTLSVTNSPVTYDGSPQAAIVTGSVPGIVSNIEYDGSSTVPTDAGTYAITADFAPTDPNYNTLSGASAGNFVIQKATPTLSVTNSPVTYTGYAQAAIVTGSVDGIVSNIKYGGSITAPTNVGTYGITADFVPTDPTNYSTLSGASAGYFVIQKATVAFSSATYSVAENAGTASITVNLSGASTQTITVNYATSDGSATAGSDYTAASGTLTFNPGDTSKTFNVTILNDAISEGAETVNLTLSSPGNATLGSPSTAVLTINDGPQPTVAFSSANYSVAENAGTATITVNLSGASAQTITVNYATSNGSATAGSDYTADSGTLTFNPGDTSKTFNVTSLDDAVYEGPETVNLALSSPYNTILGSPNTAVLTINDNETPVPLSVTTTAVTNLSAHLAKLNGNLTGLGAASLVQVSFQLGLSTSYSYETTPQLMNETGVFSFYAPGLSPNTTYHYRAKAVGDSAAYGPDMTFTTNASQPPEVTTQEASDVAVGSVTLNGYLDSLGTALSVRVSFEYGLTESYDQETTALTMTTTGLFNIPVDGLTPGANYHFRVKVVGDSTSYGIDMRFHCPKK
jgi:hypothetical protein